MTGKATRDFKVTDVKAMRAALLAWYAGAARAMPWRETVEPYKIWLSETMLQQTTVAAVVPYYLRFLARFPTVESLAAAPVEDVLHLWQGLGYYRRAHLLHAGAKAVVETHGGIFPDTEAGLLALPGVGPYTAAAVAALAFDRPASVLDGNVERVVSRVCAVEEALPSSKPSLRAQAARLADPAHPRLYANAIMELGAVICRPKAPLCGGCPWAEFCTARAAGNPERYPVRAAKKATPVRRGVAVLWRREDGALWLRKRADAKLLHGLYEPPNWGWEARAVSTADEGFGKGTKPASVGRVRHTFTHFTLELEVWEVPAVGDWVGDGAFYAPEALPPLPTLFGKVLDLLG